MERKIITRDVLEALFYQSLGFNMGEITYIKEGEFDIPMYDASGEDIDVMSKIYHKNKKDIDIVMVRHELKNILELNNIRDKNWVRSKAKNFFSQK
ncbi:MAG: hypothetical protein KAT05_14005 [Spirochaetes bacterium]|nr:hypothetical protein [Spirochaetota bacterium]